MYNQFLGTQLPVLNVKNMLGEDYQGLVDHFGDVPAVFEAESELNEVAYNKAIQSLIVSKSGETYDVIVYACDGVSPYVRGNYFVNEGVGYLAINGVVNHEEYDLSKMKTLGEVISV
jgi:hypothetical protein